LCLPVVSSAVDALSVCISQEVQLSRLGLIQRAQEQAEFYNKIRRIIMYI